MSKALAVPPETFSPVLGLKSSRGADLEKNSFTNLSGMLAHSVRQHVPIRINNKISTNNSGPEARLGLHAYSLHHSTVVAPIAVVKKEHSIERNLSKSHSNYAALVTSSQTCQSK